MSVKLVVPNAKDTFASKANHFLLVAPKGIKLVNEEHMIIFNVQVNSYLLVVNSGRKCCKLWFTPVQRINYNHLAIVNFRKQLGSGVQIMRAFPVNLSSVAKLVNVVVQSFGSSNF